MALSRGMVRYGEYLRTVYAVMARFVIPTDVVIEVCVRHDRGILSREIIPHSVFIPVDMDSNRAKAAGGLCINVLTGDLPECDVLISTAIFHHHANETAPELFRRLTINTKRRLIVSGPNGQVLQLFGDHKWHMTVGRMCEIADDHGWRMVHAERIGLSEPLAEILLVFEKVS